VTSAPDLVVLSPHPDDAVLSVGALVAARARAGATVEVITVFTRAPDPARVPAGLAPFADHAVRAAEDARALARLGVSQHRWDLPERVWRTPEATGLRDAFRTPDDLDGFAYVQWLRELIGEVLDRARGRVLAPLGIGHHVDHTEVAVAAMQVAEERRAWDRVGFYEDFYAMGERSRQCHPVTGGRIGSWGHRLLRAPGWAAPVRGIVLWATPFIGSGPYPDHYVPVIRTLPWRAEIHPVSEPDEELQLAAVADYASQIPALGGMRRLGSILRRAHRVRGGELLWSVSGA
jgi:LmbE family N-acetylglucosaminyl deacetylase